MKVADLDFSEGDSCQCPYGWRKITIVLLQLV